MLVNFGLSSYCLVFCVFWHNFLAQILYFTFWVHLIIIGSWAEALMSEHVVQIRKKKFPITSENHHQISNWIEIIQIITILHPPSTATPISMPFLFFISFIIILLCRWVFIIRALLYLWIFPNNSQQHQQQPAVRILHSTTPTYKPYHHIISHHIRIWFFFYSPNISYHLLYFHFNLHADWYPLLCCFWCDNPRGDPAPSGGFNLWQAMLLHQLI